MEGEVRKGIIVRLVASRGYGFILQDDKTRIFFHAIGCCSPEFECLREGMTVEYMITQDHPSKRTRAVGVVAV